MLKIYQTLPKPLSSYIPRGQNILSIVFKEHFNDFREVYDETYSRTYGKYRIDRITEVVEGFIKCGDYKEGLARIKSTGCPQGILWMVSPCGLDTGDALRIVATENELFYYFRDALDSETSVDAGKLRFILVSEALKMFLEQKLDGARPSRLIDYLLDRGELKG